MIIKKCTIITEEYNINVYSDENRNTCINVTFASKAPPITNMCILDDSIFYVSNDSTINYGTCYEIKCIVQDALKYYEFWEEIDEEETEKFINSPSYFFV